MAVKTTIRIVDVDGHTLRVGVKRGEGTPLLVFNGIGANFELLEPLTQALDGIETIVFDVPGVGGSAPRLAPYRFGGLARIAARMLDGLGYRSQVDVLGVSWGGALAQQFAHSHRERCRRLVLAATSAGALMVPGSLFTLSKMFNPRRYSDSEYLRRVAPALYGGEIRRDPSLLDDYVRHVKQPPLLGYLHQQLALTGWTSLFWLPALRQPTLVVAGNDDPLVPLINAQVLARLIPGARLHVVDDGHLFLVTGPQRVTPVIRGFLSAQSQKSAATRAPPRRARPVPLLARIR